MTAPRQKSIESGWITPTGRADHLGPTVEQAGHFARDWRKLRARVGQMIDQDPRFQAIRGQRARGNAAASSFATKDGTE